MDQFLFLCSVCKKPKAMNYIVRSIVLKYQVWRPFSEQFVALLVMTIMDSLRWSSLIPQGQCLLSPLILVILDSSKFYDFLVKALFKLHSTLPPDTLTGHRERFYDVFRKTKKFYEEAANLQYFKYLVSIPTLPTVCYFFHFSAILQLQQCM